MGVSRRTFLKVSGLATAGLLAGNITGTASANTVAPGIRGAEEKVMVNDASKCIGCLSCSIACKKANGLADIYRKSPATNGDTWTTVSSRKANSNGEPRLINVKMQCMHCEQASCIAVCPTGAAYKRADGISMVDQDTCIGCKYCVVACPFNAPGVSEDTGTARKCTLCETRLREGKIPACAEACPAGAIQFGDRDEMLSRARLRVSELKSGGLSHASLYGLHELGGLKVFSIVPNTPESSGLPVSPKLATADSLVKWFAGLATAGYLVTVPLRRLFSTDAGDENESGSKGVR